MPDPQDIRRQKEHSLLLVLLALLLFASPLTFWWASGHHAWFLPYLLWLLLILAGAWLQVRHRRHEL
ncbi:MAG TPA: UTP--glucose-1-phosphate uridylyltransferase [Sedimenticola thiotaurini]|uniref:UTP--glucose-1-phosphate uridylyltransferase n=1 Tax=Sedimenticola thiotaurini TaxID=1543721 RepID=A0A831W3Y4_9GAMM|nr:UTP--glucose-1-phosphate uridylyltransferase [Sedimenticola thiotaurini]